MQQLEHIVIHVSSVFILDGQKGAENPFLKKKRIFSAQRGIFQDIVQHTNLVFLPPYDLRWCLDKPRLLFKLAPIRAIVEFPDLVKY